MDTCPVLNKLIQYFDYLCTGVRIYMFETKFVGSNSKLSSPRIPETFPSTIVYKTSCSNTNISNFNRSRGFAIRNTTISATDMNSILTIFTLRLPT